MAKKIKIWQHAVLCKGDDGNVTLVGQAKEALTTLHKNNVNITICLLDVAKVDAEKCLKDNNVPYDELKEAPAQEPEKYDAVIVTGPNVVQFHHEWKWCMNEIAGRLFGKHSENEAKSEQQKMDQSFEDYKKFMQNHSKKDITTIG